MALGAAWPSGWLVAFRRSLLPSLCDRHPAPQPAIQFVRGDPALQPRGGHHMRRTEDAEMIRVQFHQQLVCKVMFLGRQAHEVCGVILPAHAARQDVMPFAVSVKHTHARPINQAIINSLVIHQATLTGLPSFIVHLEPFLKVVTRPSFNDCAACGGNTSFSTGCCCAPGCSPPTTA